MGDTCHLILQAIEYKLNYHQNEDKAFQSDLSLPVKSYGCPALRSEKDNIEF
jgi:hypothetical protein